MSFKIQYCRLERAGSDSWITYRLPRVMSCEDSYLWIADNMPGWEFVSGCPVNPDTIDEPEESPPW